MNKFVLLFAALALSTTWTNAGAAIVLLDSIFDSGNATTGVPLVDQGSGVYSYTFGSTELSGFTAAGSDKLVLGFANNDTGALAGPPITSITYDGVELSEAVQFGAFRNRNSIYYLDDVASDGDLVITLSDDASGSNQTGYALGLYALEGTTAGVADQGSTTNALGASVDVATVSGFVLNVWSRNNGGLELSGTGFTEDFDEGIAVSGGALVTVMGSSITTSPGSYVATVTGGNSTLAMASASFNAVPEPASFALLVCGALLGVTARRRR